MLKGDEAGLVAAAVRGGTLNEIAAEAGVSTQRSNGDCATPTSK